MSQPQDKKLSANEVLAGVALLLGFQLAGELLVAVLGALVPGLVFPGPVAGMVLLLVFLIVRGQPGAGLKGTSSVLLGALSLLFIPSAVGIVRHGDLIFAWGVPLLVAIIVSTALTLVVTVAAYRAVARLRGQP